MNDFKGILLSIGFLTSIRYIIVLGLGAWGLGLGAWGLGTGELGNWGIGGLEELGKQLTVTSLSAYFPISLPPYLSTSLSP